MQVTHAIKSLPQSLVDAIQRDERNMAAVALSGQRLRRACNKVLGIPATRKFVSHAPFGGRRAWR